MTYAVTGEGILKRKSDAGPALTSIAPEVPYSVAFVVSTTETVCTPDVSGVTETVPVPFDNEAFAGSTADSSLLKK